MRTMENDLEQPEKLPFYSSGASLLHREVHYSQRTYDNPMLHFPVTILSGRSSLVLP